MINDKLLKEIASNPAARLELEQQLSEKSLYYFARFAWNHMLQGRVFKDNWHIHAICDHLEAVYENDINYLLINIPVRCMKSLLVSVFFPAWCWVKDSTLQFLTISHDKELATRNGVDARDLILGDWYQGNWGNRVKIKSDQAQKTFYKNTSGGHRMSRGVMTKITGHNCDIAIADDPHSSIDVISKTQRHKVIESWQSQCMMRFNDPDNPRAIITMQRLHHEDLSAMYENDPNWSHLCIPMEYDCEDRSRTFLDFKDPRTEKGELMWPDRFPQDVLDTHKPPRRPAAHFASQFQQRPTPDEGDIIKSDWINFYKTLPEYRYMYWSWDTAIKDGEENDFSVGTLWAITDNGYYLVDMYREKLQYPNLRKMVKLKYDQSRDDYSKIKQILIEDKASGQQLLQDFKAMRLPTIAMMPGKNMAKSKIERLQFCSSQFEAGNVYFPEDKPWIVEVIDELTQFPNAAHDDIVDTITQVISKDMYKSKDGGKVRII